jgi:hypothetical protein
MPDSGVFCMKHFCKIELSNLIIWLKVQIRVKAIYVLSSLSFGILIGFLAYYLYWQNGTTAYGVPSDASVAKLADHFAAFTLSGNSCAADWEKLGTNAIPVVLEAVQRRDRPFHYQYKWLYSKLPAAAKMHLPIPAVDAPLVRYGADVLLASNREKSKILAPALSRILANSRDPGVRYTSVCCLLYYSGNNPDVTAALVKALWDSDVKVRVVATNALKDIDSEAALKAGVR